MLLRVSYRTKSLLSSGGGRNYFIFSKLALANNCISACGPFKGLQAETVCARSGYEQWNERTKYRNNNITR